MGRSWPLPGAGAPRGAKETPPAAGAQGSTAEGLRRQTTRYTLTVPTRPLRPATHGHPRGSPSSLLPDVTHARVAALTSKGRFRQVSHWTICPQILSPRRGSDTGSQETEQPEGTHRLPPKRQEDHREDGFLPEALLPGDPGVDTAGAGPAPPTLPDSCCSLQRLPPWDDRTHPGHQARAMAQAQAEPRPGAVGGWRSVSPEVGQLSEEPQGARPDGHSSHPSATAREPGGPSALSAQGGCPLTMQCTTQTLPGSRRSQACMFLQRRYRLRRLGARRAAQPQSETCREGGSPAGCRHGLPHSTRRRPPRRAAGLGSQAPARVARAADRRLRAHSLHRERRPRAE